MFLGMYKPLSFIFVIVCVFLLCANVAPAVELKKLPDVSLTLIPPTPVTDKIQLDIRTGIWNRVSKDDTYQVYIYLDEQDSSHQLYEQTIEVAANTCQCVKFRWPTAGKVGKHTIIAVVTSQHRTYQTSQPLEVLASDIRSTRTITGAWLEFYHWSEAEGRLWNKDIGKLTDEQWKELIRGMHEIGMNLIIIQDTYRNPDRHVGNHNMDKEGFKGLAYYPSKLYPRNALVSAKDPVEAVLAEADKLGMYVMMGVGCYAWFDHTEASLEWHKEVADELWQFYGHHPSFYGWYVSEEGFPSLGRTEEQRQQLVHFIKEFKKHVNKLAPDKPVMLAPSSWGVAGGGDYYDKLLKHLDIMCPCGFHRQPANDYTGEEAAQALQKYCDKAGAHLWIDIEVFLFGVGTALYPRPIEQCVDDLVRYTNFEKVLCYSYTGIMNSPKQSRQPGGPATVALYKDYQRYLKQGPRPFSLRVEHAALGGKVDVEPAPDGRYQRGDLTNGLTGGKDYVSAEWLGFHNTDVQATVALAETTHVESVAINCLQFATAGIVLPREVTFEVSADGTTYRRVGHVPCETPAQTEGVYCRVFQKDGLDESARYVRIQLKSGGEWLFVDEVIVNRRTDQK